LRDDYYIAERIRREIHQLQWQNNIQVTLSGCAAELQGDKLLELLQKTDELLYRAKENGKTELKNHLPTTKY